MNRIKKKCNSIGYEMKQAVTLIFLINVLAFTNCRHQSINTAAPKGAKETITGTVHYINLEGGFWGIITKDGRKFDPVNLPTKYQKEGLEINFTAEKLKDAFSIHMWGQIIKIQEIKAINQPDIQNQESSK
jgi:hypothetical protein